jgi:hypothetical protein
MLKEERVSSDSESEQYQSEEAVPYRGEQP